LCDVLNDCGAPELCNGFQMLPGFPRFSQAIEEHPPNAIYVVCDNSQASRIG
jgi:hypothetical protein